MDGALTVEPRVQAVPPVRNAAGRPPAKPASHTDEERRGVAQDPGVAEGPVNQVRPGDYSHRWAGRVWCRNITHCVREQVDKRI